MQPKPMEAMETLLLPTVRRGRGLLMMAEKVSCAPVFPSGANAA
jgi:hypothetical protein